MRVQEQGCLNNSLIGVLLFVLVVITEIAIVVINGFIRGHDMDYVMYRTLFREGILFTLGVLIILVLIILYKKAKRAALERREQIIRVL